MGLYLVLPLLLNRSLLSCFHFSPPNISVASSPRPKRSTWAVTRASQPLNVRHLRHHLRRPSALGRGGDQRDAVALAAFQDPSRVAPLFPPRDASLRPRLLLVLPFLPVALRPHVAHRVGRSTTS